MNRIRELRTERGWSQAALAVRVKTPVSYVNLVEKHGYVPQADLRKRFAEALSTTEAELWPEEPATEAQR